ncbi:MAG: type II toxin-antitoxin system RelE/ParE family toxin [Patescibacteria group bacterium]|jgi:mRNA interferase RelE/StbE
MEFDLSFTDKALKDLDNLDKTTAKRLLKKLIWITKQNNPLSLATKLTDTSIGDVRFRIGDYRAIGIVNYKSKKIIVVAIGNRRDVYR